MRDVLVLNCLGTLSGAGASLVHAPNNVTDAFLRFAAAHSCGCLSFSCGPGVRRNRGSVLLARTSLTVHKAAVVEALGLSSRRVESAAQPQ